MHSTSNLKDGYIGSGNRLRNSVRYHGKENHKMEILEFLEDREALRVREREIINEGLLKDPMCMNLMLGGEGGGGLHSEEHAKKFFAAGGRKVWQAFSKIHQNKIKEDPIYKEKWRESLKKSSTGEKNSFYGKTHSDSTKNKMSIKASERTGNKNSQFGTRWINNGNEDKKIKGTDSLPDGWEFGRMKK